jgi:hypothetical protein
MELFYKFIAGFLAIFIYRFLTNKNLEEVYNRKPSIYSTIQNVLVVFLTCYFLFEVNKNNEPVVSSVDTVSRVVERAKCRNVMVEDEEVKIKFLSAEDAEIFAGDLKNLLNNKGE